MALANITDNILTDSGVLVSSLQGALTLTTTGTSGAATLVGATLNIPQYQSVLTNPVTGTGTTNTLPKFTGASTIGNSNITDTGSLITLGSNSLVSGNISIGETTFSARSSIGLTRNISGDPASYGIINTGQIQSGVTSLAAYNVTSASTQVASFTLNTLSHYYAEQGTIGAGSTVNTQNGFQVHSSLIGATNNFGFRGQIPAGTNRWNIYMDGTANNYMAGSLGIGSTSLTQFGLRLQKNITGAVTSYGISSEGVIQSDVTTGAALYSTSPTTQATTFTLANLYHYVANQGTLGAGSTITNQYGFFANTQSNATNNFGFYGNIASGTGRWNLYMNGTAYNYLGGRLGIGLTTASSTNVGVNLGITGSTISNGIYQFGTVQSDVTSSAYGFRNQINTAASAFTLGTYSHYASVGGTIGAGSTVTNQIGFIVESSMTGATNNFGFYGTLASAANTWNIYMAGTANNYMAGSLGIGSTGLTGYNLRISLNPSAATSYGIMQDGLALSSVTTSYHINRTLAQTQAATFTLPELVHYYATQGAFGAGSTVGNQYGFIVGNLTGATNNYGFYGNIASGTNRWNLYMNGTASNYMAGDLGIGTTAPVYRLEVNNSTGDDHIAAVGTTPSLQLMSANTSPANWGTIGMATATNNFIVGSAAGDLAIVNRGTTAGNILFGFGSTERMRLTSGGALCVGRTTAYSAGFLLNVEGNMYASAALQVGTTIQTGAPTGGTAQSWRLGEDTNTLYTATRTIRVEIAGSVYYLLAVKSSDL